ncbi:MAG: carboxypeptidase regulatory-like domain-containing protein [Ignavibacteria bacterium]|nr:carboxypeptidase regulatory-like domain-containing protein [Ignavibacteria bacterium]
MQRSKILIVFLFALFSLNCGSKDVADSESWKEEYGIKPNTGILAGKITLVDDWQNLNAIIYLTDKNHSKLIAYDSISSEGDFIIKNLPEGRYYIRMTDRFVYENIPLDYVGYTMFNEYSCRVVYVNIFQGVITYFVATLPVSFTNTMPTKPLDSCSIKIKYNQEINKQNIINIHSLKNGNKKQNKKKHPDLKGNLKGKIVDAVTNNFIIDATVYLEDIFWITKTDSIGNFEFLNISPGKYTIKAFKSGYHESELTDLQIKSDTTSIAIIRLTNSLIPEKPFTQKWVPLYK